jgi:hypothetical protein
MLIDRFLIQGGLVKIEQQNVQSRESKFTKKLTENPIIDINDLPVNERHNKLRTVNFQMFILNAYLHTYIMTEGSTLIKMHQRAQTCQPVRMYHKYPTHAVHTVSLKATKHILYTIKY